MKNYLFQLLLFTLFSTGIAAQPPVTAIYGTGGIYTYTVNPGYTAIVTIECWGGGGSGGGGGVTNVARGGGGGGAYAKTTGISLVAGNYTVTVGAGGIAPVALGTGQAGVNSSFTTLVIAQGGRGGANGGGAGGTVAACTGVTKFAGGRGGNRQSAATAGGGGGGSANTGSNGGNGVNGAGGIGGNGGAGSGAGGKGGNTGAVSLNGIAPGGGGAGKGNLAATSGNGADGRVIVFVNTVLAIKINYLNGEKNNGFNTLNWQASCSSDKAIFEIERSADGRNFTLINTITATQQQCLQPFTYVDNTNITGTVFYRIKSVDVDGNAAYSAIIKLGSQQKEIRLTGVLPNPVGNQAQLNITAIKKDKVELSIITMEGKLVQRKTVQLQSGSSIINLNVENLQKGVYFINGVFGDGQTGSVKFVKL